MNGIVFRNCRNLSRIVALTHLRSLYQSHVINEPSEQYANTSVIINKCDDIIRNLAFEDWLFKNAITDDTTRYLVLWQNKAAVVCGWHQNPWLECNLPLIKRHGITLVRRKSGGGTVFHDEGNVNCSIICHKKHYDKKSNLKTVLTAIQDYWPHIDIAINDRSDIILDGIYKISGTASKLSGLKTYHHFTLLLKADAPRMDQLLHHHMHQVTTHATRSTPSRVAGLSDVASDMTFDKLAGVLSSAFMENSQTSSVTYVYPDEVSYPGLDAQMAYLQDWSTVFGRSPKFTVTRRYTHKQFGDLEISAVINKGIFVESSINLPSSDADIQACLRQASQCLLDRQLRACAIDECVKATLGGIDNAALLAWLESRIWETFSFV